MEECFVLLNYRGKEIIVFKGEMNEAKKEMDRIESARTSIDVPFFGLMFSKDLKIETDNSIRWLNIYGVNGVRITKEGKEPAMIYEKEQE